MYAHGSFFEPYVAAAVLCQRDLRAVYLTFLRVSSKLSYQLKDLCQP